MRKVVKEMERSGWISQKAQAPARAKIIPIAATKIPSVLVNRRGPIFLSFLRPNFIAILYPTSRFRGFAAAQPRFPTAGAVRVFLLAASFWTAHRRDAVFGPLGQRGGRSYSLIPFDREIWGIVR